MSEEPKRPSRLLLYCFLTAGLAVLGLWSISSTCTGHNQPIFKNIKPAPSTGSQPPIRSAEPSSDEPEQVASGGC
jgi:hypothetical protein